MGTELVVEAKADPKRPYKMYAVFIATGIVELLTFSDELPRWLVIALTVALPMLAVYVTPNPIKTKKSRIVTMRDGNDPALFD